MEHLFQKSKCSIFHNIFKYMIFEFQMRQWALLRQITIPLKMLSNTDDHAVPTLLVNKEIQVNGIRGFKQLQRQPKGENPLISKPGTRYIK